MEEARSRDLGLVMILEVAVRETRPKIETAIPPDALVIEFIQLAFLKDYCTECSEIINIKLCPSLSSCQCADPKFQLMVGSVTGPTGVHAVSRVVQGHSLEPGTVPTRHR